MLPALDRALGCVLEPRRAPLPGGFRSGQFRRFEERLEGRRHSAVHAAVTDLTASQLMGDG
jgi:hypothetical protein